MDRLITKVEGARPDHERVTSTAETDDQKQKEEQTPEEKAEQFGAAKAKPGSWQKYSSGGFTIKPMKFVRNLLSELIFRHAVWSKRGNMLIVDAKWANNKVTEGAVLAVPTMEDFMKARRMKSGDKVPNEMWPGDEVELGIPVVTTPSGLHHIEDLEREASEPPEAPEKRRTFSFLYNGYGRPRWDLIGAIIFAIAAATLLIIYSLR